MMSFRFLIRVGICIMMLAIGAPLATMAQHGHELATNTCVVHIGSYKMYFNSYQPDAFYDRQFCKELPGTGNTVLVFDFVEHELRSMPVEIRIIKDTGAEQNLESVTVVHFPPKVYPSGSIDVKYNFDTPGKFVGLVSIGDKQEQLSRFSFSIGQTDAMSHLSHYIMIIVPLVVAIGFVVFYALRDRRKPSQVSVSS